jgi:ABC-2 type transport system permease protein
LKRSVKQMNKYTKAYLLGLQSSMEYRLNFLLGLISFIFPLTIQVFLWSGIFNNSPGDTVYGYTYPQMISYAVFAALVSRLVSGGLEWEVLEDIKNGGLSKFLVKPIGYMQYRIFCFLGQKSANSIIIYIIVFILLFLFYFIWGFKAGVLQILVFTASVILSLLLNFFLYFSLAAIAFWINEAGAVFVILGVVVNIISGGIFPLDIFGDKILKVFRLLPFQYTIFYPVNILCGRLSYGEMINGLFIQVIWIVFLFACAALIWKIGRKHYTAVGM